MHPEQEAIANERSRLKQEATLAAIHAGIDQIKTTQELILDHLTGGGAVAVKPPETEEPKKAETPDEPKEAEPPAPEEPAAPPVDPPVDPPVIVPVSGLKPLGS